MSHRRMVQRSEHESEAEGVDRLGDPLRRLLEREPERLEHVRGPRDRADRTVPVLRDGGAGRGGDDRSGRRDVERARAVSPRADDVDDVLARGPNGKDVGAHRLGAPGDLVGRLALRPQSDEKAADLGGRRLAAHDLAHDLARLVPREVVPVEERLDRGLDHAWSVTAPTTPYASRCRSRCHNSGHGSRGLVQRNTVPPCSSFSSPTPLSIVAAARQPSKSGRRIRVSENDDRPGAVGRHSEPCVGVVRRVRAREAERRAIAIDRSRLAVVPCEHDRTRPLRGREAPEHLRDRACELRPANGLDRVLVEIGDRCRLELGSRARRAARSRSTAPRSPRVLAASRARRD